VDHETSLPNNSNQAAYIQAIQNITGNCTVSSYSGNNQLGNATCHYRRVSSSSEQGIGSTATYVDANAWLLLWTKTVVRLLPNKVFQLTASRARSGLF
jgi:hypothetical protein